VPNPDRYFWPGQFVNVRLILATKKDAVLVPVVAQQIGQQGAYVYVVKPDQTAEVRPITPGQRQADMLVVEKGLEPGERVIVAGQLAVVPNGKVMVTNPPATQSAGGM
jgi:multidrug efflux system membrane fusion protein